MSFFQACNSADDTILSKQSTVIDTLAINNTVPSIVIHSKDSFLQMHQDTLFFQDKKFNGTIFNTYSNGDTAMTGHFLNGLDRVFLKNGMPISSWLSLGLFRLVKRKVSILGFGKMVSLNLNFILQRGSMMA